MVWSLLSAKNVSFAKHTQRGPRVCRATAHPQRQRDGQAARAAAGVADSGALHAALCGRRQRTDEAQCLCHQKVRLNFGARITKEWASCHNMHTTILERDARSAPSSSQRRTLSTVCACPCRMSSCTCTLQSNEAKHQGSSTERMWQDNCWRRSKVLAHGTKRQDLPIVTTLCCPLPPPTLLTSSVSP